ncbi:MAG TPA: hypothetical protein VKQ08_11880, partial [Cyclobacteriaceae bacterium]|nr:hypothetical protein [Cyclobacteriaceae bacterium]
MHYDRLFQELSAIHQISEKFRMAIERELVPLSLPKNHILLEAPKVSDQVYFLDEGFAMIYRFVDSQRSVEGFWRPGQIMMSAKSFFEQVPSLEFIQLMEQSKVLCLSHAGALRLLKAFPESYFIYGTVINQYLEQCRERLRDIHHLNAERRHGKLLSR